MAPVIKVLTVYNTCLNSQHFYLTWCVKGYTLYLQEELIMLDFALGCIIILSACGFSILVYKIGSDMKDEEIKRNKK